MSGLSPLPLPPPAIFSLHRNNHLAPSLLGSHHRRLNHSVRPSASSSTDPLTQDVEQVAVPFSGCKACGKEEVESGCNGEGRIQGGIATVPGFGWWPIKAYRPCPGFLASGGNYRRRGQSMDEVAFGGGKQAASSDDSGKRKKAQSNR